MAEKRSASSDRDRWPTPDADGTVRLTREGDHLVPAHHTVVLPARPVTMDAASERDATVHPALLEADPDTAVDPVVAVNRARLQALHQRRSTSPAVADAFFSWFWAFFLLVGVGGATQVLIDLRIVWAAAVGFGVDCVGVLVFTELLERHEQAIMRRAGAVVVPRPTLSWRQLSPPRLLHEARAHLAALSIDDSELEDQLDALVRPGCDSYDLRPANQSLGRSSRRRAGR